MRALLTTDTIGGVWTFTKELATGLLQKGNQVALVSFGGSASAEQTRWCSAIRSKYGSRFRFDSSSTPLEWMPANDSVHVNAEPLLLRVANDFSPEILHSSQFCFGSFPLAIPRLITAHSDVLSWAAACRPKGLDESTWLAHYRLLVQRGLDLADAVVTPTAWMMRELRRYFPVRCETHVIPNGRSIDVRTESQPRTLQAVSAGRLWDEAKNVAILSKVGCPLPVKIAGCACQEVLEAPNSSSNVTFVGALCEDDLLAVFRQSSLYLATSIYEPFGLAPLEAALCGCAVIANDIPSLREVWANGALYFDGADTLTRTLAALAKSPALLECARQASMHRAKQFTRARMVESYIVLYNHLISAHPHIPVYERVAYA